ncbi:MAG TPA: TauD/TfdA family dioxygenase, partial [Steroidobacteraceae bacterium]|nr:TauD/TfdA family dioxygenase [Steroidobacteraceae bacterium]
MAAFEFRRFDAALGAEIRGVDLSTPLDDETFAQIRHALLEGNGLLLFRDQRLTPEDQIAFSRRFGPLMI